MSDPASHPDAGHEAKPRRDHASTTGTPRWMRVIGISVIALVVVVVILLLTGGGTGGHGPGMHTP